MPFKNKGVELLNLPRTLNHSFITSSNLSPLIFLNFETPSVIYTLEKSIQSEIFNFNNFFSSLDLATFVRANSILPCHCADSCFIDKYQGYILTLDLRIIRNNKLIKFFTKRPKYRESISVNIRGARSEPILSLNIYVDNWCTESGIQKSSLSKWKQNVLEFVDDKISELSRRPKYGYFRISDNLELLSK